MFSGIGRRKDEISAVFTKCLYVVYIIDYFFARAIILSLLYKLFC